jgi:hypothetical protein
VVFVNSQQAGKQLYRPALLVHGRDR